MKLLSTMHVDLFPRENIIRPELIKELAQSINNPIITYRSSDRLIREEISRKGKSMNGKLMRRSTLTQKMQEETEEIETEESFDGEIKLTAEEKIMSTLGNFIIQDL